MIKKRIPASSVDFKESDLPKTRTEQFFDILRTRYSTLLKLGLWLLLVFVPLIAVIVFKDLAISSIYERLLEETITKEEASAKVSSVLTTANFINVFSYLIIFIGLSGFVRIYRDLLFEDSLFFKDSFALGFKQNIKQMALLGLFTGLFIFAINYFYSSGIINNIASAIIIGILVVIVLPITLFLISYMSVYNDNLIMSIKNSMLLYLRTIPYMLIFLGVILAPFLLSLFNVVIIKGPLIVILIIFALPIYWLAFMCFSYHQFDKHINKNQYPELVKKGLYKGQ